MGFGTILDFLASALGAIDGIVMSVALVLVASIFAAIGGLVSWRLRLYGAMIGGMIVNVVAKAEGAGYGVALAAMVVVTALAVAFGSAGLIVQLMRMKRS